MQTHRFIIYLFLPPKEQWRAAAGLTLTYNQVTFEPIKWTRGVFVGSAALKEAATRPAGKTLAKSRVPPARLIGIC